MMNLLSAILTLLSAVITCITLLGIAYLTRRYHEDLAAKAASENRRRATWEFIKKSELDNPEWTRLRLHFARVCSQEGGVAALAQPSVQQRQDAVKVTSFLNHFELIAIAIKNQMFDEKVYAEWFRGSYVKIWEEAEAFIIASRHKTGRDRIFIEFERLAKKWKKDIEEK